MTARRAGLAAFTVLLGAAMACATASDPGDPGYRHDVSGTYAGRLTMGDAEYEAVVRMRTAADGTVSGSFAAAPLSAEESARAESLEGDFGGVIHGDTLVWRSAWIVPATGCSGVLRGRGPVAAEGASVEGEIRVVGACIESASGAYRLSR